MKRRVSSEANYLSTALMGLLCMISVSFLLFFYSLSMSPLAMEYAKKRSLLKHPGIFIESADGCFRPESHDTEPGREHFAI